MRHSAFFVLAPLFLLSAAAQNTAMVVSAANPNAGVTADSLATVYGDRIATVTASATSLPWPTSLGDMPSVGLTDAAGQSFTLQLLFVSPTQMNVWIPAGVAPGMATMKFPVTGLGPGVGAAALRNVAFTVAKAAPGLFSVDASGLAAATAVRVTLPTNLQSAVPVFGCVPGSGCAAVPINVGVDAPVYLSLFGTGIRGAGADVAVTIAGTRVVPTYAGPQGTIPGLDQVNVLLPISLHGSGTVEVVVTAGGVASNAVRILIQ